MTLTPDELLELLTRAEARGRAESAPHVVMTPVEVLPPGLATEVRQAIVTMRRIAQTPGIRRRALGDCRELENRAGRLEAALGGQVRR